MNGGEYQIKNECRRRELDYDLTDHKSAPLTFEIHSEAVA